MFNILLFTFSCAFVALFVRGVWRWLGQEGLIAWIALCAVLANLLVLKQITLFGLNATASDIFAVSGLLGLTLLQKEGGEAIARKAIQITLMSLLFFCCMGYLHLWYEPSQYDTMQSTYETLLSPAPRLLVASLIAYHCSQWTNLLLIRAGAYPILAMLSAQWVDTILFAIIGLMGQMGALWEVILVGYLIKIGSIFCTTLLSPYVWRKSSHAVNSL